MSYSSYDHDNLEPANIMRIERRMYFESGKADLSEVVKLPLAEILSLRAESAAAGRNKPEEPCFLTKPWNMPGRFPSPTLPTSGRRRGISSVSEATRSIK